MVGTDRPVSIDSRDRITWRPQADQTGTRPADAREVGAANAARVPSYHCCRDRTRTPWPRRSRQAGRWRSGRLHPAKSRACPSHASQEVGQHDRGGLIECTPAGNAQHRISRAIPWAYRHDSARSWLAPTSAARFAPCSAVRSPHSCLRPERDRHRRTRPNPRPIPRSLHGCVPVALGQNAAPDVGRC